MSAILLVVADAGAPTSGDAFHKTTLELFGHMVTYISDETAENVTGFDGVVISESVVGATIGSKYATVTIPVVTYEPATLADLGFITVSEATANGQTSEDQITWLATSHPIAIGPFGPLSGTDTIFSSNQIINWFDISFKATGVVAVAELVSSGGLNITCAAAEQGSTLNIGPAPARRVFIWPQENALAALDVDGLSAIKNAYTWAFETQNYQLDFGTVGRGSA